MRGVVDGGGLSGRTGGREHQGSSCRGVGVVRLEPFDPSSGSGRGLLAESSNAEDVRPKATARLAALPGYNIEAKPVFFCVPLVSYPTKRADDINENLVKIS